MGKPGVREEGALVAERGFLYRPVIFARGTGQESWVLISPSTLPPYRRPPAVGRRSRGSGKGGEKFVATFFKSFLATLSSSFNWRKKVNNVENENRFTEKTFAESVTRWKILNISFPSGIRTYI